MADFPSIITLPMQLRIRAGSIRQVYPDNSFKLDEANMMEAAADEIDRLAAQQDVREADYGAWCETCGWTCTIRGLKEHDCRINSVKCLCGAELPLHALVLEQSLGRSDGKE